MVEKPDADDSFVVQKQSYPAFIPPRHPISPPHIDPHLEHLPFHLRGCETLRYTLNALEYALSPSGRLRQWGKIQLSLFLWLMLPLLLLGLPLLAALSILTKASVLLLNVAINVGIIFAIVMVIGTVLGILYVIFK